jgi:cytochrome c-type biogenesis protein
MSNLNEVKTLTPVRPYSSAWLSFGGLLVALVTVIAIGYLAFRGFATTPNLGAFNLYLLAIIAGVASFFSPCAFPILPSYFSFYHQARETGAAAPQRGRSIQLGLSAALGVMTFTLVLGVVIAVLGTGFAEGLSISGPEPSHFVRIFRGFVGVVLLTLGIAQLAGRNLKPKFVDAFAYRTRPQRDGGRGPATSLYLYGLGYNAAGVGCTGPILAGLMISAAFLGASSALTAFVVFSLTMGILMLVISGLVAASRQTLINRLKAAAPKIKWAASILLIVVGLFNIYTALNLGLFVQVLFP